MTSTAIQRVPPRGLTSVAYPTLFRSLFYTFANPNIGAFTPPDPGLASGPVRLVAHRAMLVRVYVDSRAPGIRAARAALPVHAQVSLITPTATIPIGTARPARARDLGVTPHQSVAVERKNLARTLNVIVPAARITPAVTGVRVTLVPQRGWRECPRCAGLRDTYALTGLHIETVTPSINAGGQPSEALPLDVFFLSWPGTPAPTGSQRKAALAKVRDYVQAAYPLAQGAVQVYDHSDSSATGLALPTPPQDAQGRYDCNPILDSFQARIQATLDGTVPGWSTRDPASGAVGTTPSSPTQRGQAPPLVMPRYMGIISDNPNVHLNCGGLAPAPGRALIAQPFSTPHELGHNITYSHAGDFHGEDGPGVGQQPGTQPYQPFPDVPRYPKKGAGRRSAVAYSTRTDVALPLTAATRLSKLFPVPYDPRRCAQTPVNLLKPPKETGCDYDLMSYGGPRVGFFSPADWNAAFDALPLYRTCHLTDPSCPTGPPAPPTP